MCLAVPMKIKAINGYLAEVEAGRLKRSVNIRLVPKARIGDYVLVHAGFAIERIDPGKAKESLRLLNKIGKF